jgi:signal peptidase I
MAARNLPFQFQARGQSMLPTIADGELLRIEPPNSALKIGDIVLFRGEQGLKAHRIVRRRRARLVTQGDSSHEADGEVSQQQILGLVVAKECSRTGKQIRLHGLSARGRFRLVKIRRRISLVVYWFKDRRKKNVQQREVQL